MITARPAQATDLPRVQHVTERAYADWVPVVGGKPLPLTDDYESRIARGEVSLVERDGEVAGIIVLETHTDHLLIQSLAVLPEAQGHGIGRWMLDHLHDRARTAGLPKIKLYTNIKMARNIAIYRRYGFVETGRRRPKPDNPDFVAVDMELTLLPESGLPNPRA